MQIHLNCDFTIYFVAICLISLILLHPFGSLKLHRGLILHVLQLVQFSITSIFLMCFLLLYSIFEFHCLCTRKKKTFFYFYLFFYFYFDEKNIKSTVQVFQKSNNDSRRVKSTTMDSWSRFGSKLLRFVVIVTI